MTRDWDAFHRAMRQVLDERGRPQAAGVNLCTICRRALVLGEPIIFLAVDKPGVPVGRPPEQHPDPSAQVGFHGPCHDAWYADLKAAAWALVAAGGA